MTSVCGLDPSLTGFGVCVLDGTMSPETWRLESEPQCDFVRDRIGRSVSLVGYVMRIVHASKPSVICIEGYSYCSHLRGSVERAELGGILRSKLLEVCGDVHEVPPTTLKKFVTGTGKGGKVGVVAAATKRWGVEFSDSDRYDAYCLARMAACIAKLCDCETDSQRQAIDSVLHGSSRRRKVKQRSG